jgi:SAM-dependent methyltransferase
MLPEEIQRRHYAESAAAYDQDLGATPEHEFGLYLLLSFIDSTKAQSLLDVGAGTGRGLRFLMRQRPALRLQGIEPIEELRTIGYSKGVPEEMLREGSGYALPFADGSFDIVSEFGVLHHVQRPEAVVNEMLRVARFGVFLSDTNNLGQGAFCARLLKNVFYWLGLWKPFSLIRTRGRGFVEEPNDGLWYYYTVYSHLAARGNSPENR